MHFQIMLLNRLYAAAATDFFKVLTSAKSVVKLADDALI